MGNERIDEVWIVAASHDGNDNVSVGAMKHGFIGFIAEGLSLEVCERIVKDHNAVLGLRAVGLVEVAEKVRTILAV